MSPDNGNHTLRSVAIKSLIIFVILHTVTLQGYIFFLNNFLVEKPPVPEKIVTKVERVENRVTRIRSELTQEQLQIIQAKIEKEVTPNTVREISSRYLDDISKLTELIRANDDFMKLRDDTERSVLLVKSRLENLQSKADDLGLTVSMKSVSCPNFPNLTNIFEMDNYDNLTDDDLKSLRQYASTKIVQTNAVSWGNVLQALNATGKVKDRGEYDVIHKCNYPIFALKYDDEDDEEERWKESEQIDENINENENEDDSDGDGKVKDEDEDGDENEDENEDEDVNEDDDEYEDKNEDEYLHGIDNNDYNADEDEDRIKEVDNTDHVILDKNVARKSDLILAVNSLEEEFARRINSVEKTNSSIKPLTDETSNFLLGWLRELANKNKVSIEESRTKRTEERMEIYKMKCIQLSECKQVSKQYSTKVTKETSKSCVQINEVEEILEKGLDDLNRDKDLTGVSVGTVIDGGSDRTSSSLLVDSYSKMGIPPLNGSETQASTWSHANSFRFLVDTPLFPKFLDSLNYMTECAEGHIDVIDQIFDIIRGEEEDEGNVGTTVERAITDVLGSVQIPPMMKKMKEKAGILVDQI